MVLDMAGNTKKKAQPKVNPQKKSVDDMDADELKAYAKRIGISVRDIENLSIDRLRQNCKARLYETFIES